MNDPTSQLDERFSETAAPTSWEQAHEVLEQAQLSWIATVRPSGRPHVTPLVAVWLDGAVHFCTLPDEQKAVNLAANPAVVLTTGANTWERGLDVMVEGNAVRVTDRATLDRLAAAWGTKWDGRWQFVAVDGGFELEGIGVSHVYAVEPTKVLAFGKGPGNFSHTRHLPQRG